MPDLQSQHYAVKSALQLQKYFCYQGNHYSFPKEILLTTQYIVQSQNKTERGTLGFWGIICNSNSDDCLSVCDRLIPSK